MVTIHEASPTAPLNMFFGWTQSAQVRKKVKKSSAAATFVLCDTSADLQPRTACSLLSGRNELGDLEMFQVNKKRETQRPIKEAGTGVRARLRGHNNYVSVLFSL